MTKPDLQAVRQAAEDLRVIAISCLPHNASKYHEIDAVVRKLEAIIDKHESALGIPRKRKDGV